MADRKKICCFTASFTIEAAILVPVILAIIFLLLQTVLYFHDTVCAEAWLYQKAWRLSWEQEREEAGDIDNTETGQEADLEIPRLAIMRYAGSETIQHDKTVRIECAFQVCLLPRFVTVVFNGQPETAQRQAAGKIMNTPGFLRIAGAILEEKEN